MSRSIQIRCSGCRARIKAPIQLIGQTRACPGCGKRIIVQRLAPKDSGPILLFNHAPARPQRAERSEPKLILVADDDAALNDGLRSILEKRGYRVIQAADGIQAKEMAYHEQPDLMILDVSMPRMGGYPVLEYLQTTPQAPPVIMITAQEGRGPKADAERLGAVDFLRKPFAMGKLLESVEKGLAGKQ
jgi:CheY-like chemotaxis protein